MHRYVLILAIGITLCGCDGHVRSFKLIPRAGKTASEAAAERQKLVDAVKNVAIRRGYAGGPSPAGSDTVLRYSKELDRGRVEIRLLVDTKSGGYEVSLLDWPSTARSAESTVTEAEIQEELNDHKL